uniref:Uncharacterized protein n=1 Tax=Haptolina brevifila TaxID=156173 RepID=A0A7S2JN88_9EUKA
MVRAIATDNKTVPCRSERPGDFAYMACAPFCQIHAHCEWCKCRRCALCGGEVSRPSIGANNSTDGANAQGQGPKLSGDHSMELTHVRAALKSSEERMHHMAERLRVVEAQLGLCRKSSSTLRANKGMRSVPPPPPRHGRTNGSIPLRCIEAVDWAVHVGVVTFPSLYPGLNASSAPAAFQTHLHLNDPTSRCPPPESMGVEQEASEGLASLLLLIGVLLCALCNAYSLGYLQPNRQLRSCLRALGCPQQTLVR